MKRNIRTGIPHYTYKQKHAPDKKIYRRLAIIGGLTVVLILAIWFWGVTFVSILGFLGNDEVDNNNQPGIELPLRIPTIEELPEFTKNESITISGSSNAEVALTLFVNGSETGKTTADAGGNFSFVDVALKEGLNLLKIVATNDDEETQEQTSLITLDKTKPDLSITTPKEGEIFPDDTESIVVKGKTESEATVLVNLIQAITNADGSFSHTISVSSGENKIEIKSTDQAGNVRTEKITVTVSK